MKSKLSLEDEVEESQVDKVKMFFKAQRCGIVGYIQGMTNHFILLVGTYLEAAAGENKQTAKVRL